MDAPHYHWNRSEIAADVVDGEAVIIHLTDGTYFSLDPVGTVIWQLLGSPQPSDAITAAIVDRFGIPLAQAQDDTDAFLADLLREHLVVRGDVGDRDAAPAPAAGADIAYARPVLTKYTDMANLLALDPPLPGTQDFPWKVAGN